MAIKRFKNTAIVIFLSLLVGCISVHQPIKVESVAMPVSFGESIDSTSIVQINWKQYYSDKNLVALIDSALKNNQELNIRIQEIEILKNEARAKKGEYLPTVGLGISAGLEKEGRYTRHGSVDENGEIVPGRRFPEPLANYEVAVLGSWEVDVWKKLRNSRKAAALRYLAGREGRNFLVTNLIAEIANTYYELMALDNQLAIIEQNLNIQTGAVNVVRQQKTAARVTQLAVNRFEAQMLNTKNLQYAIRQQIVETENKLGLLTGRFPSGLRRNSNVFHDIVIDSISAGIPSQLMRNRPDIRQAEMELAAAKLDVKAARASFYPAARIVGGIGFQAFDLAYFTNPESLLFNLAGDLVTPLVNRNAIKAQYNGASARQIQAVFNYERSVLNAYVDVVNQLSSIHNSQESYQTKSREADMLMESVTISNSLFQSARADYLEVLLTQQEALESKMELVEIKLRQFNAKVNIYRALGGGWN